MHVLIVAHGYPTSNDPQWGCFERDQANALQKLGHKVTVVAIDGRYRYYKREKGIHHIVDGGINAYIVYYFPLSILFHWRLQRKVREYMMLRAFKKVCADQGMPDVIYAHYMGCMAQLKKVKCKYRIPILGMEHWSALGKSTLNRYETFVGNTAYSTVDRLLCVSPLLQVQINKHFNRNAEVLYNMVDDTFLQYPIYNHNCSHEPFKYITVGSLIPLKGFDILIKAFSRIKDNNSELYIIGDGHYRNYLSDLAKKLNVYERVHFLGRLDRKSICCYLSESNSFVLASRSETFGVVYIEAMAMGLPVIATRCGVTDILIDEKCGLLIDVDDVDALVNAMNNIQENISRYDCTYIRESIKNRFSQEIIAAKVEKYLNELIEITHD